MREGEGERGKGGRGMNLRKTLAFDVFSGFTETSIVESPILIRLESV